MLELFERRTLNAVRKSTVAVCLTVAILAAASAQAQPVETLQVPIRTAAGEAVLEFRYIPAGTLAKGQPAPEGTEPAAAPNPLLAGLSGAQAVSPFYIAKTELTFAQARAVLSEQEMRVIQARVRSITGVDPDNQYLRDAPQSSNYPAFALSLGEVATICERLNEVTNRESADGATSIEAKLFRVPAHYEWQFACRAATNEAEIARLPHLNRWTELDGMDPTIRGMVEEEWQKAGRPLNALTGSQFQIFDLVDARMGAPDALDAPQQILAAYFRTSLGIKRDVTTSKAWLSPVGQGEPNHWNLYEMHDNVCEWVLVVNSRDELLRTWKQLTDADATGAGSSRNVALLAGGGFAQAAGRKGAWRSFSIWGGYPYDENTGAPVPVSIAEALDADGLAIDQNAGARLVMDRTIRTNWLPVVRKSFHGNESGPFLEQAAGFEQSIAEAASKEQRPELSAALTAYVALAQFRAARNDESSRQVSEAMNSLSSNSAPKPAAGASVRLALAGGSAPTDAGSPKKPSESESYFRMLSRVAR